MVRPGAGRFADVAAEDLGEVRVARKAAGEGDVDERAGRIGGEQLLGAVDAASGEIAAGGEAGQRTEEREEMSFGVAGAVCEVTQAEMLGEVFAQIGADSVHHSMRRVAREAGLGTNLGAGARSLGEEGPDGEALEGRFLSVLERTVKVTCGAQGARRQRPDLERTGGERGEEPSHLGGREGRERWFDSVRRAQAHDEPHGRRPLSGHGAVADPAWNHQAFATRDRHRRVPVAEFIGDRPREDTVNLQRLSMDVPGLAVGLAVTERLDRLENADLRQRDSRRTMRRIGDAEGIWRGVLDDD